MKKVYIRRSPSSEESLSAAVFSAGIGALVAGVAFYLARAFLARDEVVVAKILVDAGDEELDPS